MRNPGDGDRTVGGLLSPLRTPAAGELLADRIMTAIAACVARARELYPQQPRRGEGTWWVRPPETAVARTRTRPGAPA